MSTAAPPPPLPAPQISNVSVDKPHLVDTGACCSHCHAMPFELLRCSACLHAWYCNQDCQRAGFKEHKKFCKALKLFNNLHSDLPQDIRPTTPREFYVQRTSARQLLQTVLKRPLSRGESRAIINEAKCSICMRTRDQVAPDTLVCCPRCHWGWTCNKHTSQYMSKGHTRVLCDAYLLMNNCELWTHGIVMSSGKLPSYCPEGVRPTYEPVPSESWDRFKEWRPTHRLDPAVWAALSKRLSQPMTAIQALQHHYTTEELSSFTYLNIHVIGAGAFEVPADTVWEEILHLTPSSVRHLQVDFVGPELALIMLPEEDGMVLTKSVCKACVSRGHSRTYTYNIGTYHDFLRRRKKLGLSTFAHLAIAFNSGMHEEDQKLWRPTLHALFEAGTPIAFTSYTKGEATADAQAWQAIGGEVTLSPKENPYRACEPIMEPSGVDDFYYQSYFWFCGRGLTKEDIQGEAERAVGGLTPKGAAGQSSEAALKVRKAIEEQELMCKAGLLVQELESLAQGVDLKRCSGRGSDSPPDACKSEKA